MLFWLITILISTFISVQLFKYISYDRVWCNFAFNIIGEKYASFNSLFFVNIIHLTVIRFLFFYVSNCDYFVFKLVLKSMEKIGILLLSPGYKQNIKLVSFIKEINEMRWLKFWIFFLFSKRFFFMSEFNSKSQLENEFLVNLVNVAEYFNQF